MVKLSVLIPLLLIFASSGICAVVINGNSDAYLQEFYFFTVSGLTNGAERECEVYALVDGNPVFVNLDKKIITDAGIEEKADYMKILSNVTIASGRFFFSDHYFTKGSYNVTIQCPYGENATKEVSIPSSLYRPMYTKTMGYSIFGINNIYPVVQLVFGVILAYMVVGVIQDFRR